jgi:membrane fusion protein, multidrug efflux system
VLAAGVLVVAGCARNSQQSGEAQQRPPARVSVALAVVRDVPVYLDEIGKTLAMEMVSIVPQVGGKLTVAHVQDGDYVKKGQLLFEIDARPFEAALASAEALRAQSEADLDLAQIEFRRTDDLAKTGTASQMEYDQDRISVAVAEAKVAAALAAVRTASLNLEYTKIYSPIDGRAGARLIDPGNVVKENDAPLQVVRRLDPLYVEFTVPENDMGMVRKYIAARAIDSGDARGSGLKVEIEVPGDGARLAAALDPPGAATASAQATASAPSATPRDGVVTFLDNAVQAGTGTLKLRATVGNADHSLWPGQFVHVRVILTTLKDAVLIPATAQQLGQQGPYVYVVTSDGTAELRPIVPGQRQGELVVIERGVKDGEQVVVTGHMTVMPGAKVMVANGAAAPGAGDAAAAGGATPE